MTNSFLLLFFFVSLSVAESVFANSDSQHSFDLGARARYTDIEDAGNSGRAASLLLRGTVESTWTDSLTSVIEYDIAEAWLQDEHSDGLRFNNQPRVPDVPGDELNQAFVNWQNKHLAITLGRQRIELANQRFIGSVAFWQNDQTYDAFSARYPFLSASNVQYSYVNNVNRFWGEDAGVSLQPSDLNYSALNGIRPPPARGDHKQNTHLLQLELREWDYSQWLAWYYAIDNKTASVLSNNTLGLGYRFNKKLGAVKYSVEVDFSLQEREIDTRANLFYYRIEAGFEVNSTQFLASQERLGSDSGLAFITPLGSINDFQGWADIFFITPQNGVIDTRLQIDSRFNPFRIDARYHSFSAAEGGDTYGNELDVDVIWKPNRKQKLLLRYADFTSESPDFPDNKSLSLSWSYNL